MEDNKRLNILLIAIVVVQLLNLVTTITINLLK